MTQIHRLRVPYTNQLPRYQHTKPCDGLVGDANLTTKRLNTSDNSSYTWNASLRQHKDFGDCGDADERVMWRCSCGRERDPQSDDWDRCPRCGSEIEPEWR